MDQPTLDQLQELKEQYAQLMRLEERDRLDGWEARIELLAQGINDLHGRLLREATRR